MSAATQAVRPRVTLTATSLCGDRSHKVAASHSCSAAGGQRALVSRENRPLRCICQKVLVRRGQVAHRRSGARAYGHAKLLKEKGQVRRPTHLDHSLE